MPSHGQFAAAVLFCVVVNKDPLLRSENSSCFSLRDFFIYCDAEKDSRNQLSLGKYPCPSDAPRTPYALSPSIILALPLFMRAKGN